MAITTIAADGILIAIIQLCVLGLHTVSRKKNMGQEKGMGGMFTQEVAWEL